MRAWLGVAWCWSWTWLFVRGDFVVSMEWGVGLRGAVLCVSGCGSLFLSWLVLLQRFDLMHAMRS